MAIPRPHRNEHHYIPDPGKDHIVFDGEGIIVRDYPLDKPT